MTTAAYMQGRRKYGRPQALLLSDTYGVNDAGVYVPQGTEFEDFIILSDHNRSEIQMSPERIETRKRMINGRMRSYWLADKVKISTSWKMLPSRATDAGHSVGVDGKNTAAPLNRYVVDNGAGGSDLLKWYENHTGSFYVWIAYDKPEYTTDPFNTDYFKSYADIKECFFSKFDYSIAKRSGIYDFWDVSLELEEV